ncbi:hypothetical protein GW796_11065 [archaeon]|nr:hypothetical protein [archaeon]
MQSGNLVHINKAPLSERGLEKFSNFKDREYYPNLEDLAYALATQQHEYSQIMIRSMKNSKVKEGILNLSKGNEIDKTNDFILEVKDKIDVVYDKNGKLTSKKLKLNQLLKKLSHDINIYFPIVDQRKNVLQNGEIFWVAFNPPDHDSSEYFVRAFNQFGEDSLISSKIGIKDNLLVIAYSENQENYSPALRNFESVSSIAPIDDCPELTLFGEPCFPNEPDPDPVPDPILTEEGINFLKFKTLNINDGFLDGDLEIEYSITQSYTNFSIDNEIFGTSIGVNSLYYINRTADYNAGHWYEFRYRNNNNWFYSNALRRYSDRQKYLDISGIFGLPNLIVYNNSFRLTIREVDVLSKTTYINEDYNFKTFNFNIERQINTDGGTFYYLIEKKQFPSTSF